MCARDLDSKLAQDMHADVTRRPRQQDLLGIALRLQLSSQLPGHVADQAGAGALLQHHVRRAVGGCQPGKPQQLAPDLVKHVVHLLGADRTGVRQVDQPGSRR